MKLSNDIIEWIRMWFEENGKNSPAVVGISGGKDSSVVAALCVEALGKDRVIGILMPNGVQADIADSHKLVDFLGIRSYVVDIEPAVEGVKQNVEMELGRDLSEQANLNIAPRIRMTTLYAISQTFNGRVANTCNLSENYVGYATRFGDEAGDFSPLGNLTVREVKIIGHELGLPSELIEKTPSDGLCGKSDEDNLGFTYKDLDAFIEGKPVSDYEAIRKISARHAANVFKLKPMATFKKIPSDIAEWTPDMDESFKQGTFNF